MGNAKRIDERADGVELEWENQRNPKYTNKRWLYRDQGRF